MRWLIAALLLLAAACAAPRKGTEVSGGLQMYDGRAVPDQVSLRAAGPVRIVDIDGYLPNWRPDQAFASDSIDEFFRGERGNHFLLPGRHVIRVVGTRRGYKAEEKTMWFDGAPGGAYLVRMQPEHETRSMRFWIEDRRTGQPTGGVRGSPDEPK